MQHEAFSFWGLRPPNSLTRGSAPGPRKRHSLQTPSIFPQCLLFPLTWGVWIKAWPGPLVGWREKINYMV